MSMDYFIGDDGDGESAEYLSWWAKEDRRIDRLDKIYYILLKINKMNNE